MRIRSKGGKNQDVTEEVDAYYQTNNKSGGAILYGLFALVVTLIIAAGLYFGGRAVYRVLTGNGESSETAEQAGQDTDSNDGSTQGTAEGNIAEDESNGTSGEGTPGISGEDSEQDNGDMPFTGDSDNLPATGSPTGM